MKRGEALGIDFASQSKVIQQDQVLSSTVDQSSTVGGKDGKQRDLLLISTKGLVLVCWHPDQRFCLVVSALGLFCILFFDKISIQKEYHF
jgi:hypothetical protein